MDAGAACASSGAVVATGFAETDAGAASLASSAGASPPTDAAGAGASADLRAVRAWVLGQLLEWAPHEACDPLQFVRGRLLDFDAGTLWWQDDFVTTFMSSRRDAWLA